MYGSVGVGGVVLHLLEGHEQFVHCIRSSMKQAVESLHMCCTRSKGWQIAAQITYSYSDSNRTDLSNPSHPTCSLALVTRQKKSIITPPFHLIGRRPRLAAKTSRFQEQPTLESGCSLFPTINPSSPKEPRVTGSIHSLTSQFSSDPVIVVVLCVANRSESRIYNFRHEVYLAC
jgi:hypothetical protein